MFIGEYSHSIDEKGRLSVPVKFRPRLASGCVLTRGLDHCLWLFTQEEWQKIAEKVAALPLTQSSARSFSRLILAGAMDLVIDKAGRINLPNYLKEYAGIKNKVVLTGMYSRVEIWPEESWKNFKQEMEEKSDEIAEGLSEIGI